MKQLVKRSVDAAWCCLNHPHDGDALYCRCLLERFLCDAQIIRLPATSKTPKMAIATRKNKPKLPLNRAAPSRAPQAPHMHTS